MFQPTKSQSLALVGILYSGVGRRSPPPTFRRRVILESNQEGREFLI